MKIERLSDEAIEIVINKWKNEDWATRHIRLSRGHYEDILPLVAQEQLRDALRQVGIELERVIRINKWPDRDAALTILIEDLKKQALEGQAEEGKS